MASMNWYEWLPGWLGLAGGLYGAWRAWRTERRVGARYPSWTVSATSDLHVTIQSNLPYTARKVEVIVPSDIIDMRRGRDLYPVTVRSRGVIELLLAAVYMTTSTTIEIRWRRWGISRRETLPLPIKERDEYARTKWDRHRS